MRITSTTPLPFLYITATGKIIRGPHHSRLPLKYLYHDRLCHHLNRYLDPLVLHRTRTARALGLRLGHHRKMSFLNGVRLSTTRRLIGHIVPRHPHGDVPSATRHEPLFTMRSMHLNRLVISTLRRHSLRLILRVFCNRQRYSKRVIRGNNRSLVRLSTPSLLTLSIGHLFRNIRGFLLLGKGELPISFSSLRFSPLVFSNRFSYPFRRETNGHDVALTHSIFRDQFFYDQHNKTIYYLLS